VPKSIPTIISSCCKLPVAIFIPIFAIFQFDVCKCTKGAKVALAI
jgi:hypothetical protein